MHYLSLYLFSAVFCISSISNHSKLKTNLILEKFSWLSSDRFCFRSLLKSRTKKSWPSFLQQNLLPPTTHPLQKEERERARSLSLGAFTQTSSPSHHHPDTLRGRNGKRDKLKERKVGPREGIIVIIILNKKEPLVSSSLCPIHDFFFSPLIPLSFFLTLSFPILTCVMTTVPVKERKVMYDVRKGR